MRHCGRSCFQGRLDREEGPLCLEPAHQGARQEWQEVGLLRLEKQWGLALWVSLFSSFTCLVCFWGAVFCLFCLLFDHLGPLTPSSWDCF